MKTRETWHYCKKHFEKVNKWSPGNFDAMLELIAQCEALSMSSILFASLSHEAIYLSTERAYNSKTKKLCIYNENDDYWIIEYDSKGMKGCVHSIGANVGPVIDFIIKYFNLP